MNFGQELVDLNTAPTMFRKFSVHAGTKGGGLNDKHSTLFIKGQTHFDISRDAKMSLDSMKQNRLLFIHIQTLPLSSTTS